MPELPPLVSDQRQGWAIYHHMLPELRAGNGAVAVKILALLALLLLLSACAPADPYQARADADARIQGTQRAVNQARAQQVEKEAQEQSARMATQGAAEIEISLLQAQAQATVQAINNGQARLDAALLAGQATRAAWEYDLSTTATMANIQATQTLQPTVYAAAMQEAAANARTAQIVSNGAPFLVMVVLLALIALIIVLVWYLARRADLSIRNREMAIEVIDRHNGAVTVSSVGAMIYRHDAEVIDRAPLNIPRFGNDTTPVAPIIFDEPEPARQVSDPLKAEAIRLTSEIVSDYGDDYRAVVGWRGLDGWTSSRWQKARGYLEAMNLIRKDGEKWEFVTGARDALIRLNAPEVTR